MIGSLGKVSIFSFFVAHNITTGEGGMVCSDDKELIDYMRSIREFGRLRNSVNIPFSYTDDYLTNYDQRYVFMNVGHNMRMTDVLASAGIEQVNKLESFNKIRRSIVKKFINKIQNIDEITFPFDTNKINDHSFYAFPMVLSAAINRKEFCQYMEDNWIETRAIMSGNLARQPGFRNKVEKRVELPNADKVTNHGFFIGCHPNLSDKNVDHVCSTIKSFFN